jgi:hypothetical protein
MEPILSNTTLRFQYNDEIDLSWNRRCGVEGNTVVSNKNNFGRYYFLPFLGQNSPHCGWEKGGSALNGQCRRCRQGAEISTERRLFFPTWRYHVLGVDVDGIARDSAEATGQW